MTNNINYRQKVYKSLSILSVFVTEILRVKLIKQMDVIIFLRSNKTFNITKTNSLVLEGLHL